MIPVVIIGQILDKATLSDLQVNNVCLSTEHLVMQWICSAVFALNRCNRVFTYSSLAQLVEQRTVNPLVAGSSPAGGAIWDSSLRGRSAGLKNRRMKVRHLPVPPLGAIDESAKSPASQAGGCEFKPHWHHHP